MKERWRPCRGTRRRIWMFLWRRTMSWMCFSVMFKKELIVLCCFLVLLSWVLGWDHGHWSACAAGFRSSGGWPHHTFSFFFSLVRFEFKVCIWVENRWVLQFLSAVQQTPVWVELPSLRSATCWSLYRAEDEEKAQTFVEKKSISYFWCSAGFPDPEVSFRREAWGQTDSQNQSWFSFFWAWTQPTYRCLWWASARWMSFTRIPLALKHTDTGSDSEPSLHVFTARYSLLQTWRRQGGKAFTHHCRLGGYQEALCCSGVALCPPSSSSCSYIGWVICCAHQLLSELQLGRWDEAKLMKMRSFCQQQEQRIKDGGQVRSGDAAWLKVSNTKKNRVMKEQQVERKYPPSVKRGALHVWGAAVRLLKKTNYPCFSSHQRAKTSTVSAAPFYSVYNQFSLRKRSYNLGSLGLRILKRVKINDAVFNGRQERTSLLKMFSLFVLRWWLIKMVSLINSKNRDHWCCFIS